MRSRFVSPMIAAALLLVLAGCKGGRDANTAGATQTTSETGEPGMSGTTETTAARPLAKEDREFMMKAAQSNMAEVSLGAMAAQKGTSPAVRSFGTHMVTDHNKANGELQQIAMNKGVTLPTSHGKEHQDVADKLAKLTGASFDREYAEAMVKEHERDVKEYEKASRDAKDAELRAFAARNLVVLQDHLRMARQLQPTS